MTSPVFELLLFHVDSVPLTIRLAEASVDGVIVDWESSGKQARQAGWDTQIALPDPEALSQLKLACACPLLCRIDHQPQTLHRQVEAALVGGGEEILLPMIRTPAEVEFFLGLLNGRCRASILVETQAAVDCIAELTRFPLYRIYIGLNDLAIDRREKRSIFLPLIDGTVERIREQATIPLGIAGLTHPLGGWPIPARLLLREMARLDCRFSFLRLAFYRDATCYPPTELVKAIRAEWSRALARGVEEIEADRLALQQAVRAHLP